jgi:hypothetical protein
MPLTKVAVLAVTAIAATTAFSSSAGARDRYYDEGYRGRYERVAPQQNNYNYNYGYGPRVNGRRDPNSYDGYRTGNPRTCGSDFFRYDERGVPYGPYCN